MYVSNFSNLGLSETKYHGAHTRCNKYFHFSYQRQRAHYTRVNTCAKLIFQPNFLGQKKKKVRLFIDTQLHK